MVSSNNPEMSTTRDLLGELSKVSGNKNLQEIRPLESKLSPPLASLNNDKKHYAHNIGGVKESHPALKFLEESCLELNLFSSAPGHCHSVCTLDKVKSALLRAEKESCRKKRSSPSSNDKQEQEELDHGADGDDLQQNKKKESMHAVGCPGCLMYVMTFKTNPKCPRCNSAIPSPLFSKKPRFDLNASL